MARSTRALHGECRNKGMSNIYSAWAYIGVGEGKGRRGGGGGAMEHGGITSPGLPPMAEVD